MARKKWDEDDLAYNGESEPMSRQLTPRERDVLCRVIHSIVYPWTSIGQGDPHSDEARRALLKYTRVNGDQKLLYDLIPVISPRKDDKRG